ncbi:glycoside hydrolase superfamily [Xylariales sp. AK1849]|nr:glycoside hydrolase superfamily [Xylariales sp. AK1849]
MKSLFIALSAIGLATTLTANPLVKSPGPVARSSSNSWAGSNLYFLQGLSDSDQDDWLDNLVSYGGKVVRVWVNAQGGSGHCEKGSKLAYGVPDLESNGLGSYSDETLDLLDATLVKISGKGLKAVISPHDGNALAGDKCDAYCKKWGSGTFYESQDAADQYDQRLDYILNYTGKTSNQTWKDWGDAIVGFDIQNEPFNSETSECSNSAAASWVCDRAQHIRSVLGTSNPIKISTGGLAGDFSNKCTFGAGSTTCDAIDMIAVHRYAGPQGTSQQWSGSAQDWVDQANGKLVYIEEWGVNSKLTDPKTDFPAEMDDIVKGGLPSLYWQILPPKSDGCDYDPTTDSDPFGIFMDSGVDFKTEFEKAASSEALQDWSGVLQ